jgi:pyridoxine/pyridoxamine 5'-phosphate oxidase
MPNASLSSPRVSWSSLMTLEEVFDIAKTKRYLVVSTVNEAGAPEGALMGFALTQANEIVFDTLSTSRKAVNLARNPATALVIGWEDGISLQMEGVARRPAAEDLANAKEAYFRQWPDGRARENWPDIAYIVVQPKWIRYANYSGVPVIEEFKL